MMDVRFQRGFSMEGPRDKVLAKYAAEVAALQKEEARPGYSLCIVKQGEWSDDSLSAYYVDGADVEWAEKDKRDHAHGLCSLEQSMSAFFHGGSEDHHQRIPSQGNHTVESTKSGEKLRRIDLRS